MQVQWIAKRVVRRQGRDTNTVAGLVAAVAADLGGRGAAYTRVSTTHRVVQTAGRRSASKAAASSDSQVDNKARMEEQCSPKR